MDFEAYTAFSIGFAHGIVNHLDIRELGLQAPYSILHRKQYRMLESANSPNISSEDKKKMKESHSSWYAVLVRNEIACWTEARARNRTRHGSRPS